MELYLFVSHACLYGRQRFPELSPNCWGGQVSCLTVIYRRFRQLLIPFFLWSVIETVLYKSCSLNDFINIFIYPDGYFWFLWVLFFIAVFFQLGDRLSLKLKLKQEIVIIALCLLFIGLMVYVDIRILGFQFFAYYFLFYTVGYYLNKHNHLVTNKVWLLCLLTVLWAVMAWFWEMHELPVFLKGLPLPETILQYGYRFITALVAVYILFGLGPKLLDCDARRNTPFISLGKISLGIYVVHLLLMPLIVGTLKGFVSGSTTIIVISFIVALFASWLVVWLLSKWTVTNRLLLGKI